MAAYEWLLLDLVTLIYKLSWLAFLTHQHYGQVTTTAGHIFELNILLNDIIGNILWIILVDLDLLSLGVILGLYEIGLLVAIVGSQIETMVFLKTMNVNTMMTNTAGQIILAMTMFSYGLTVFNTLAWPSTMAPQSEILSCAYLTPMAIDFKRFILIFIYTFTLVILLSVMGFGVFRGLQIRRTSDNDELLDDLSFDQLGHEGVMSGDNLNNTPPQGRLFTIQAMICELNQERPRAIIEEDLVIQDIELNSMEVSPAMDNLMSNEIIQLQETNSVNIMNLNASVQQDPIGCVPGIDMIMKTIQKYMKNTMMSLLVVTFLLPWYLTLMYGFILNSGCEDPTIKFIAEMNEYTLYIVIIFLPLVIKLKLDRLSE